MCVCGGGEDVCGGEHCIEVVIQDVSRKKVV